MGDCLREPVYPARGCVEKIYCVLHAAFCILRGEPVECDLKNDTKPEECDLLHYIVTHIFFEIASFELAI